jgi:hypothetical protein
MTTLTLALVIMVFILLHALSWLYMKRVRATRRQRITEVLLNND